MEKNSFYKENEKILSFIWFLESFWNFSNFEKLNFRNKINFNRKANNFIKKTKKKIFATKFKVMTKNNKIVFYLIPGIFLEIFSTLNN